MNDPARANIQMTSKTAKVNKNFSFAGIVMEKEVFGFLFNNPESFNAFSQILNYLNKLKPIPDSEIRVTFDAELNDLVYQVNIPETVDFCEYLKILDDFSDFLANHFSHSVFQQHTLYLKYV